MSYTVKITMAGEGRKNSPSVTFIANNDMWAMLGPVEDDLHVVPIPMLYKIYIYRGKSGNKVRAAGRAECAHYRRKATFPAEQYHMTKARPGKYEATWNGQKKRIEIDLRKKEAKSQLGLV